MEFLDGDYEADNVKNYFEIALNLKTGDKVLIKNASCTAVALEMALKLWGEEYSLYQKNLIKIFYIGDDEAMTDVYSKIPKKYKKYF